MRRGSLGALKLRCRYEWITQPTKAGLSNDAAVRLYVSSLNLHVGDHSRHRGAHSAPVLLKPTAHEPLGRRWYTTGRVVSATMKLAGGKPPSWRSSRVLKTARMPVTSQGSENT